jgi:hypothetical protein
MSMRIPGGAGGSFKFGGANNAGPGATRASGGGTAAGDIGAAAKGQAGEAAGLGKAQIGFSEGGNGILSGSMMAAGWHKLMMELIQLIK